MGEHSTERGEPEGTMHHSCGDRMSTMSSRVDPVHLQLLHHQIPGPPGQILGLPAQGLGLLVAILRQLLSCEPHVVQLSMQQTIDRLGGACHPADGHYRIPNCYPPSVSTSIWENQVTYLFHQANVSLAHSSSSNRAMIFLKNILALKFPSFTPHDPFALRTKRALNCQLETCKQ